MPKTYPCNSYKNNNVVKKNPNSFNNFKYKHGTYDNYHVDTPTQTSTFTYHVSTPMQNFDSNENYDECHDCNKPQCPGNSFMSLLVKVTAIAIICKVINKISSE